MHTADTATLNGAGEVAISSNKIRNALGNSTALRHRLDAPDGSQLSRHVSRAEHTAGVYQRRIN